MEIRTVGVVGAGVMGIGLAHNLAQTGHRVVMVDIADAVLQAAREEIRKNLRFQGFFRKEKSESADVILGRIETSTDLGALHDADFVVENATEKWDIKKEIYPKIDAVCPAHTVFAANTSKRRGAAFGFGTTSRPSSSSWAGVSTAFSSRFS